MAGCNHSDARLVAYCGDNSVHLDPRDPEDYLNAFAHQRFRQGFAPTHFGHGSPTRFDQTLSVPCLVRHPASRHQTQDKR